MGIWNIEFDSSMSHKTLNMIKTKLGRITSKWCIPSKPFLSHSYCLINQMKQQDSINNDSWPLVWEATPKTLALCFVGISRHLETIKLLILRPHTFFCFTVSGYPNESLALLFYINYYVFTCLEWNLHFIRLPFLKASRCNYTIFCVEFLL